MGKNILPIVVTDSGAGGLFVLDKLARAFPREKFIYFSDAGNMPYGNKTDERILGFCRVRVDFAKRKNAKMIVVACNTMSAVGREVFAGCGIPVVFVLAADELSENRFAPKKLCGAHGKIGLPAVVFCTAATGKSRAISRLSGQKEVVVYAERDLAKEIEEHIFDLGAYDPRLAEGDRLSYKTVVLGCTHYALVRDKFAKRFPGATVIDGTGGLENRVRRKLSEAVEIDGRERKNRREGENGGENRRGRGSWKRKSRVVFFGGGAKKMRRAFFALFTVDGS